MTQLSKARRRGANFTVRITEDERRTLDELRAKDSGPSSLGGWLLWRAMGGDPPRSITLRSPAMPASEAMPVQNRTILDLCGGSGAWSRPYAEAGYRVVVVDLPTDVRTYVPPAEVWGILSAPPCTQFSMARNGHPDLPRDFVEGMSCVNACMRIVLQSKPRWWCLENPAGHLGSFLGTPRDTFEPYHFGDAWTKRTCLWGDFEIPRRGPYVDPIGSAMSRSTAAERAITPPGFARAFFEANP